MTKSRKARKVFIVLNELDFHSGDAEGDYKLHDTREDALEEAERVARDVEAQIYICEVTPVLVTSITKVATTKPFDLNG